MILKHIIPGRYRKLGNHKDRFGDPCCQIPQTGYDTYLHPCPLIQSHQQQADHIRHRLTALPDSCPAFQPWIIHLSAGLLLYIWLF